MHATKSKNNFLFPRKIDILNEAVLFQDKLQFKEKNKKFNLKIYQKQNSYFLKDKEVQENSINEEDDYNLEIYNNSISKDQNFLKELNDDDKYKTIQVYNYFQKTNNNILNLNNRKKFLNNTNQKFCSTSIEFNNNLNLRTLEESYKNTDTNINFLMNNLNIFKMVHKERKNRKLLNQILSKDKSPKYMIELKNSKYFITNKYSKKYTKKYKQNIDNGIVKEHIKVISQQFNGPYLKKNKISQINPIKNTIKNVINKEFKYISNLKVNENYSQNISKIKALTNNLFNRYSQIDTNVCDQQLNFSKEKNDKDKNNNKDNNNKNKKIKIMTSLNDLKKNNFMLKNNGCTFQNENSYIFNLKFYNIYDNKQNNNIQLKSKSNSMINEYSNFDENYNIKNENNGKKKKEKLPKNKIIKKRIIFEEEYIIDSNGNQKFLCVKRVGEDNLKSEKSNNNSKEILANKRSFTSNNLLISSKNKSKKEQIKSEFSTKYINNNINNPKKRKLEAKTVFYSPQISYENIFSPSNNLTKPLSKISEIKNTKTKGWSNNTNIKDKKDYHNSKSCIFKFDENVKFHQIDNYINKNNNKNKIIKTLYQNDKRENEEKNKIINKCNKIKEKPISKRQLKKTFENEKTITFNNSRNYNGNNFININDLNNNKEKYITNNTIRDKIIKKDNIYNTTIFENNKIYLPMHNLLNISDRNNFKYHEIKSISKDKTSDNRLLSFSNRSQNNHFYFESKNKLQKIVPCTSMDNIKPDKKLNSKYDYSHIFHKNNQRINISKQNNNIYYTKES